MNVVEDVLTRVGELIYVVDFITLETKKVTK